MNKPNEDGYQLWLRYPLVNDAALLNQYRRLISHVTLPEESSTATLIYNELHTALPGLLGQPVQISKQLPIGSGVIIATRETLPTLGLNPPTVNTDNLGGEGFLIYTQPNGGHPRIIITGNTAVSTLYGTFHFLRLLQTHQDIRNLAITSVPRIKKRILAHWDNLDGSIERGYAGQSLWQWDDLPNRIDPRYHDYARALASIGLNGTNLNNVNANSLSLTTEYIKKAAALADVFRPYGIRVYLAPRLSAPVELDGLPTADPRETAVSQWWQDKVDEIYRHIPDFGGFQIKANSEGQPGPQDDGANHHDGANMLATALEPHGGTVLWRAFVYDVTVDSDRAKCAYKEFVPLDGRFHKNVFVQVKNGPIDFQPREPFTPLFGAMEHTPLALELQVTQEYLGQSIHLVYLGEMWKEVLDADTYAKGGNNPVAHVVDGLDDEHDDSCIIAVANTGDDRNWCGHHFSQANWYAYGRLAWDYTLSAGSIADEWIRMTWANDQKVINALQKIMHKSWPACIDYMTPLGLHHLCVEGHHYGPDPGLSTAPREDWNNIYFHRADSEGLGFDRTSTTGSDAVSQYHSPLREQFDSLETCPEELILWFHHVPWDHKMQSGRTLWQELQHRYRRGVDEVVEMQNIWHSLETEIDAERFAHVNKRLDRQLASAQEWRDVCIAYFGQFVA